MHAGADNKCMLVLTTNACWCSQQMHAGAHNKCMLVCSWRALLAHRAVQHLKITSTLGMGSALLLAPHCISALVRGTIGHTLGDQ